MKTYKPLAGESIQRACKIATAMAKTGQEDVEFTFNGIRVVAAANYAEEDLVACWERELNERRETYEASPEYRAEQKKREQDIADKNFVVNQTVNNIGRVIQNQEELMIALRRIVDFGDDIDIAYDKKSLAAQLKTAGYETHMKTGQPKEFYNDKKNMGDYIVGQILDFLDRGMSPHPCAVSAIDKWLKMK